jgi:hypothetical protein
LTPTRFTSARRIRPSSWGSGLETWALTTTGWSWMWSLPTTLLAAGVVMVYCLAFNYSASCLMWSLLLLSPA